MTFAIAWILTRRLDLSVQIGLFDTVFKIAAFYLHERIWHNVQFGKKKPPEYQI